MSSALLLRSEHLGRSMSGSVRADRMSSGVSQSRYSGNPDDVAPPATLLLYTLPVPVDDGDNLPLRSPLLVHVVQGELGPVVYDDALLLFGQGDTTDEALVEYGAAVLDYYDMLREHEAVGRLGHNLRPHLVLLNRVFSAT